MEGAKAWEKLRRGGNRGGCSRENRDDDDEMQHSGGICNLRATPDVRIFTL